MNVVISPQARKRLSDEQRAQAAARWAMGETQRQIGIDLGFKPPASAARVCMAINEFLVKYLPPELARVRNGSDPIHPSYAWGHVSAQGNDRKMLIETALRCYHQQTGTRLRIKLRAGTC